MNSQFLIILGLIISIVCISKSDIGGTKEPFWTFGVPMQSQLVRTATITNKKGATTTAVAPLKYGEMFMSRPNFQSTLSPRFANVDYGSTIRYNMPAQEHLASNIDNPISYAKMTTKDYKCDQTKEGYDNKCIKTTLPGIKKGLNYSLDGVEHISNNTNYVAAINSTVDSMPSDVLNITDMTATTNGNDLDQVVFTERIMVSNLRGRRYGLGDYIRGDLPITQDCTPDGWFKSAASPNDLNTGAMNVLGGVNNETSNALAQLVFGVSGKSRTALGGIDMTSTFQQTLGAGLGDVNTVTSFS